MAPSFLICFLFIIVVINIRCQPASENRQESITVTSNDTIITADTLTVALDTASPPAWDPEDEMLGLGKPQWGDLDSMIARRRIRALVPYTHTFYFIDGKERRGLAFEALNLFEKALNKQLKFNPPKVRIVFIPVNREQIIPLLQKGHGDMAVAGLTITPEREKIIDFSIPTIKGLKEIVVSGPEAPPLHALSDLAGQWVYIHEGSSYHASLQRLSDSLQSVGDEAIRIEAVDPALELEDVLEIVHAGMRPFTVVEEDVARHWATVLSGLKLYTQLPVTTNISYGWVFRKSSPQLKAAIDQFITHNRKGSLIGNTLYNRYMKSTQYLLNAHSPEALKQLQATDILDKSLLALAAYNAGPSRISRLRRQAAARGLDANRWFDNVEMEAAHDIGRETV